jgi:hypothetical protein
MTEAKQLSSAEYYVVGRYWVDEREAASRMGSIQSHWLLGWRDVTDSRASARTAIFSVLPLIAVGHKFPLLCSQEPATRKACLLANLSSFVFDYVARQKIGGLSLTYFYLRQFPALSPERYSTRLEWATETAAWSWFLPRVLELTYTAWDLQPFANACGYAGPPFRWDEARRSLLRCELDAAFFHLYEIERDDVDYIMETFPIVKRKDEAAHSEYRTKRVILEIYDAMADAARTGEPYRTRLDPPPADPRVAHPGVRSRPPGRQAPPAARCETPSTASSTGDHT